MRLSTFEVKNIVDCAKEIYGESVKVYLFGSRVDDSKKGGDIDLYLQTDDIEDLFEKKLFFLNSLEKKFGMQKFDIIISKDKNRDIEKVALREGIELDIDIIKLGKYIEECDKHIQRINEAYSDLKDVFPITSNKYQNLTKDEVQALDQYLFRFSKLQDSLGDKVFKLLIKIYEQKDETISFIDILNRLEKYGFLSSAKEWMHLRKIRNEISHQYDDEPQEMAEALNSIWSQKEVIESVYKQLKERINDSLIG